MMSIDKEVEHILQQLLDGRFELKSVRQSHLGIEINDTYISIEETCRFSHGNIRKSNYFLPIYQWQWGFPSRSTVRKLKKILKPKIKEFEQKSINEFEKKFKF